MKKDFLKTLSTRRILCFVLLIASLGLLVSGCGAKKSDTAKYYAGSEKAVIALEDALYAVELCLDGKISPEECAEDLSRVVSRFEDDCANDSILDMAVLRIGVIESSIMSAVVGKEVGTGSSSGVIRAIENARDDLLEMLN